MTEPQKQLDARESRTMTEPRNQADTRKPRTIARADVQDMLALTPMQEGMLLQELRVPGDESYKVQFLVRLEGEVVTETFREAWRQVAASTEMLRTLFRWEGLSQPVQIVLKRHEPIIVIHDLTSESEPERALAELRSAEQSRGYDLTEPPYRVLLCRLTERRSAMLICNHHILYDGWSTGLLLARFFAAYGAGADKLPADLLPFKAYVQQLQQQDAAAADAYWQAYLEGLEETTRLPWEAEEAEQSGERATATLLLSAGETERLTKAAQQPRVTLATLLFAAWGLLLQRYGMTRDVVFGTTVSGRSPELQGIESMVGLFINTVPLRVHMTETMTVGELLSDVAADLRERAPYETVPLARIQQSGPAPGESLFDSIVVVENYPVDPEAMRSADGGLTVGGYELDEATPYALTLAVTVGERLELMLGSGHARYDTPGVAAILTHYRRLLLALADRPERLLAELAMLSAEEREQLIGDRSAPADTSGTIDGRFAEQARQTPQAIAVRSRDGELSYAALAQQADRIASWLRAAGLATEEIVALRLRPSPLIPAALLGILQEGGAYLPIHPDETPERMRHMLEECRVRYVLTDPDTVETLPLPLGVQALDAEALATTGESSGPGLEPSASGQALADSGRLAYVMYTSGSTGKPKGVMVEHGSVVNLASWFAERYGVDSETTVLQMTDYTFDPSVEDWFGTLLHGGQVVVAEPGLVLDRAAFRQRLEEERITLVNYVPSILGELLLGDDGPRPAALRTVICGGEPLPPAIKDGLLANGYEVYNNYGPTETTVDALSARCDESPVQLGEPVAGMRAYALGLDGEPVPGGGIGELWLAGAGVARGYLGDPARTAERFGEDWQRPGERMFRTGDLVRRDREGRLRYAGRRDEQIKIRGYRVEPGELEAALAADPEVMTAAVVAVRDGERTELHGFVTLQEELPVSSTSVSDQGTKAVSLGAVESTNGVDSERVALRLAELRERLAALLPAYMLPARVHALTALPLTRTGKIDRRQLRQHAQEAMSSRAPAGSGVPPRTEAERAVWQIWADVLGRDDFGVTDDFFAIGGDSHRLIRIHSLLGKAYPGQSTVQDLFDYRTIEAFAAKLTQADQEQEEKATTLREIEF